MTTKNDFDVPFADAEASRVQLKNGRYAYRMKCPWNGGSEEEPKELYAYKFCSKPKEATEEPVAA